MKIISLRIISTLRLDSLYGDDFAYFLQPLVLKMVSYELTSDENKRKKQEKNTMVQRRFREKRGL